MGLNSGPKSAFTPNKHPLGFYRIQFLGLLLLLLSFGSCSENRDALKIIDEVRISVRSDDHTRGQVLVENGDVLCGFLSENKSRFRIKDGGRNTVVDSIPLQRVEGITPAKKVLYDFHSRDSLFLFVRRSEKSWLWLVNSEGEIREKWDMNRTFHGVAMSPDGFSKYRPRYWQGRFYVMNMKYGEKKGPPFTEWVIDLKDPSDKGFNKCPAWPEKMAKGEVFFRTLIPNRCLNGNGELIYSFGPLPSLHIYDAKTLQKKKVITVKSRYHQKAEEFPKEKMTNPEYLNQYRVEQFRYGRVLYDPYRNLHYRIVNHPVRYAKKSGKTVRELSDKPWSVIIMDPEFRVLYEIKMDHGHFNPRYFKVVPKGWLVHNNRKSDRDKDVFSLIQVPYD